MSVHTVASMNAETLVGPSGVVPSVLVLTEFWADLGFHLIPKS